MKLTKTLLTDIIRKAVREEMYNIKEELKLEIRRSVNAPALMTEGNKSTKAQNNRPTANSSLKDAILSDAEIYTSEVVDVSPPIRQPSVQFSDKNPFANILNETARELANRPPEAVARDAGQTLVEYDGDLNSSVGNVMVPGKQRKKQVMLPSTTASGKPVNPANVSKKMVDIFTKDYSNVLKKMDEKAKMNRGHGGAL